MKVIKIILIAIVALHLISCEEEPEPQSTALSDQFLAAIGNYTYTGSSYIEPYAENTQDLSGTLLVEAENNQLIIRLDETPDIILSDLQPAIFSEGAFGFSIPEEDLQDEEGIMFKRYGGASIVLDNQSFDGAYASNLNKIHFGFIHSVPGESSSSVNKSFTIEATKVESQQ